MPGGQTQRPSHRQISPRAPGHPVAAPVTGQARSAQPAVSGASTASPRSFISFCTAAPAASALGLNDRSWVSLVERACSAVSLARAWLAWTSASAMTVIWGVNVIAADGTVEAAVVISERALALFWGVNAIAARLLSS